MSWLKVSRLRPSVGKPFSTRSRSSSKLLPAIVILAARELSTEEIVIIYDMIQ